MQPKAGTHRLSEGHHKLPAEVHILEHAFQLVGELAPTLCLQLGDHVLLCVCAGAASQQQPLGQVLLVEGFKDILALHVGQSVSLFTADEHA